MNVALPDCHSQKSPKNIEPGIRDGRGRRAVSDPIRSVCKSPSRALSNQKFGHSNGTDEPGGSGCRNVTSSLLVTHPRSIRQLDLKLKGRRKATTINVISQTGLILRAMSSQRMKSLFSGFRRRDQQEAEQRPVDNHKQPKAYQYMPLPGSTGWIRVLTIHPGAFDATVSISLQCEKFRVNKTPFYEALSYTWGSQDNRVDIVVEGRTLSVTHNLFVALGHLRYKDKSRTMWIDAICI